MMRLVLGFAGYGVAGNVRGENGRCKEKWNRIWRWVRPSQCVVRMGVDLGGDEGTQVTRTVERLYDTYPYPPDPMIDTEPVGYNWRWHFPSAYSFCTGMAPTDQQLNQLRILDAGCGTGCGTEYLVHLNPTAQVVGIDLSAGALEVARERLSRSVKQAGMERVEFIQKNLFEVRSIEGQFDLINCVGVIHHTPDPPRAIRELATKLKPGGILHLFVYALHGRWEIRLMQRAIATLQRGKKDYQEGVRLGRELFRTLPETNRLRRREEDRWALENQRDATFADMYVHPQEIDYDVPSLFDLIDGSGLTFLGFSNPRNFDLSRLLGSNEELLQDAQSLPERDRLRLVELLDPESVTHFEFFLAKEPLPRQSWSEDQNLLSARACLSPCVHGGPPANVIFDRDYFPITLSTEQVAFLSALPVFDNGPSKTIEQAQRETGASMESIRELVSQSLLLLYP